MSVLLCVLEKAVSCMQSLDPAWLWKNGPWAWSTLAGQKVPSQLVPGLSPCLGLSFPVSDSMCARSFIRLKHVLLMAPGHPHCYVCASSAVRREGPSAAAQKGSITLCLLLGSTHWTVGADAHYRSWPCSLFSV